MISALYIYPVKSLAGIALPTSLITSRGLQYDRRMMLVNKDRACLTQREHPQMALLQPVLTADGFCIQHKQNLAAPLFVPHQPPGNRTLPVTIWDDVCEAQSYDASVNRWFSKVIGVDCELVYMPETTGRAVDKRYALNNEVTSFSDGYPILIIGQSTLDDLNARLDHPLPMDRFRPNIVFTGGDAFVEDRLQAFTINGISFSGVKPCARCIITTIDQDTGAKSKEPLKTLARYRLKDNKILFGQNLLHSGSGFISTGDAILVKQYQPAAI